MPELNRLSSHLWELPISHKPGMRVPGRIVGSSALIENMDAAVFEQLANVATLPGVVDHVYCMPDGHSGYGFPIGGVAAMDPRSGVISPGGIGFDINCGMRLVATNLTHDEVEPLLEKLVDRLFVRVPAGVGGSSPLRLSPSEFRDLAMGGSRWCLKQGYAFPEDLEVTEDGGCATAANIEAVSETAIERGIKQVGTLGSGNHYLEIQVIRRENILDPAAAKELGLDREGQIVLMFHCGSRGFGHQIASDYLKIFLEVMEPRYGIQVPDRELACAPFESPEGQAYFAAMGCAINMAFANRQLILHRIREVFSDIFERSPSELGMRMIYDVSHNTAKLEEHRQGKNIRKLLVHRKGATRAFGPGMEGVPGRYRNLGQPVIIGGSMETGSYLLLGEASAAEMFYSTAHGSGRTMSRHKAKQLFRGKELLESMRNRGIYVRTTSYASLAEEAGQAYKDIDEVIAAATEAGASRPVLRLVPIGNVKG